MYCRFCGSQLSENAHFCANCGKRVESGQNKSESYTKIQKDYNIIVYCISNHSKAYVDVTTGYIQERIYAGDDKKFLLPAGNNHISFKTKRRGATLVKTVDYYDRDLFVLPNDSYAIEVSIGQVTNRINIKPLGK